MAALSRSQVERQTKTTDGRALILFHTGWSPFSNFHSSPFIIENQKYNTVEQFYQVQKAKTFGDTKAVIEMLRLRSPRRCKERGRSIENFDSAQWSQAAPDVMQRGVREKFMQNEQLRSHLLATKDAILAEATEFDTFWATGLNIEDEGNCDVDNWPGRNMLGSIIMGVRDIIAGVVPGQKS